MKISQLLALAGSLTCFAGCARDYKTATPVSLAPTLADQTVAFMHRDSDGDVAAFCTGVWLSDRRILTAGHCLEKEGVGGTVDFIGHAEEPDLYEEPVRIHHARVIAIDEDHDLGLAEAYEPVGRVFVELAPVTPPVGSDLIVIGNPMGLTWTQLPGYVAAYKNELRYVTDSHGPYLELASGAYFGNSGGGVFDMQGRLVGIVILKSPAAYIGFAVHLDTLRHFVHIHAS